MLELELDFAEEDVEFADRKQFQELISKITLVLKKLIDSFALGNVFKNGIPVAIIGEPNVGKSTLLNALVNEEKAIVSDIAGTTRDAIEDEIIIEGVAFRFIDTAGIRDTKDVIESIGIEKTYQNIEKAQLVLYLLDASSMVATYPLEQFSDQIEELREKYPNKEILTILNKSDTVDKKELQKISEQYDNIIPLSAKKKIGLTELKAKIMALANIGVLSNNDTIVSNSRHFEALNKALLSLNEVQRGIDNEVSSDLFSIDIRQALYHLGEITGEITTEDLLGNIFANFCIGK